jgi:hypothetical protein
MGPMLLELKLMKYIIFTTECKQDLVTDLVLCSACPMLLQTSTQRQNACARLAPKTSAPKMSAPTGMPTKSEIAPCLLGTHCWRAIFS